MGEQGSYTVLSPEDFRARLAATDDYILVDVRTPKEFEEGHIEGALNVDFLNPAAFDEGAAQLDPDKALMIYCRSGKRSQKASEKLKAMGFKKIYDLEGGFRNWEQ
jgi:rhodanese-related sulfurtransferase